MRLHTVWLTDFRNYEQLEITLHEGFTAILGANGVGKTNLLESLGLLATLKSFRKAPTDSLVRKGCDKAVIRATGERAGREVLIELELAKGKTRAQVNRQPLKRTRDLLGALRVTVFGPDDLSLVKEGPAVRREFLDDLIVSLDPTADGVLSDLDRIVKQRNALLRQMGQAARGGGRSSGGGSSADTAAAAGLTLDVWDSKLAAAGEHLTIRRENLLADLMPMVTESYRELSDSEVDVVATYVRSWDTDTMAPAIANARDTDVRRGSTSVGPHRDDVGVAVDGFDSRLECSQGEQRTLALALRLAGHRLLADRLDEPPLLLLDDVLSELDPDRARALLASLPPGQTVITSAQGLPPDTVPDQVLEHRGGALQPVSVDDVTADNSMDKSVDDTTADITAL